MLTVGELLDHRFTRQSVCGSGSFNVFLYMNTFVCFSGKADDSGDEVQLTMEGLLL